MPGVNETKRKETPKRKAPVKQDDNRSAERDTAGRFVPGQSGNPNGRPPSGCALSEAIRAALDAAGEDGRPKRAIIAQQLVDGAVDGDPRMLGLVLRFTTPVPTDPGSEAPTEAGAARVVFSTIAFLQSRAPKLMDEYLMSLPGGNGHDD